MGRETSALRVGDWHVDPAAGRISVNGKSTRLDVRAMRLLLCLARHGGQVVSIDDLITEVWSGVSVSPDSVYQAVTSLRRQLGDDSRQPSYIETVPRLGYRMIASVSPWEESAQTEGDHRPPTQSQLDNHSPTSSPRRRRALLGALLALMLAIVFGFLLHARLSGNRSTTTSASAAPPQQSVGVLPFLDLTEGMRDEEFADGVTEELIDKLSKVPGLHVPSATSSFYFKTKEMPVAEIAKQLNVAFLLDGSVRKSGGRIRIAARLVRADNSYVVWTETYDRPFGDLITIQDEIASEVTSSLKSSIVGPPQSGKSK